MAAENTPPAQSALLSLSTTSISFGAVTLTTSATQTLTLAATGNAPLTITSATVSGPAFSLTSAAFPLTLKPAETATLEVQFAPGALGPAIGQVALVSNSSSGSPAIITLAGTGRSLYQVDLDWQAPADSGDPSPLAGYNIYRLQVGTASWQRINPVPETTLTYTDEFLLTGTAYRYYVTTLDSAGGESAPSNIIEVAIP